MGRIHFEKTDLSHHIPLFLKLCVTALSLLCVFTSQSYKNAPVKSCRVCLQTCTYIPILIKMYNINRHFTSKLNAFLHMEVTGVWNSQATLVTMVTWGIPRQSCNLNP
jgi:hypothetical protein